MLYLSGGASTYTATYGSLDGNGGNCAVTGTGQFYGSGGINTCGFSVLGRGSASTLAYGSSSFYEANVQNGALSLNKWVSGSTTTLDSVAPTLALDTWYQVELTANGSSATVLQVSLQRLSDDYWWYAGGWSSLPGVAVVYTDSSSPITGQGYWGWSASATGSTPVYGDDWSLAAFGSANSMAAIESHDTFSGLSQDYYGAIARTESRDIASIYAKVSPYLQGSEYRDTLAARATAGTGPWASMAVTESYDVFAAPGGFTYDSPATLPPFERGDVFAAAAIESSSAAMARSERGDTFAASVSLTTRSFLTPTEAGDTFRGGLERVAYHVYANTGSGDPINYNSPIDTTAGYSYTTSPLSYPGIWELGVRAFYVISGLEEQNIECAVTIVLDAAGRDISSQPMPPFGLARFAMAAGLVRVEWSYGQASGPQAPQGFYVYIGSGGTPDYATPVATVAFNTRILRPVRGKPDGPLRRDDVRRRRAGLQHDRH